MWRKNFPPLPNKNDDQNHRKEKLVGEFGQEVLGCRCAGGRSLEVIDVTRLLAFLTPKGSYFGNGKINLFFFLGGAGFSRLVNSHNLL